MPRLNVAPTVHDGRESWRPGAELAFTPEAGGSLEPGTRFCDVESQGWWYSTAVLKHFAIGTSSNGQGS